MQALRTIAITALTLVSAGACAPMAPAAGPTPSDRAQETTVTVANHNWSDMTIYLEAGGMRHRLGTVTTGRTETFLMPRSAWLPSGDVRLVADPIGSSEAYVTERILVNRGQEIEFTVQNHLAISSWAVWE
jgi:hypothetical protein